MSETIGKKQKRDLIGLATIAGVVVIGGYIGGRYGAKAVTKQIPKILKEITANVVFPEGYELVKATLK